MNLSTVPSSGFEGFIAAPGIVQSDFADSAGESKVLYTVIRIHYSYHRITGSGKFSGIHIENKHAVRKIAMKRRSLKYINEHIALTVRAVKQASTAENV